MKSKWTKTRPTKPGKYQIRDLHLGWGPIEVNLDWGKHLFTKDSLMFPSPEMEGACIFITDMPSWVEWRDNTAVDKEEQDMS